MRGGRPIRFAAGHAGHADPEDRGAGSRAWIRDFAAHPASFARSLAGSARLALSRAASAGETRLATSDVGRIGERAESQVLPFFREIAKSAPACGIALEPRCGHDAAIPL